MWILFCVVLFVGLVCDVDELSYGLMLFVCEVYLSVVCVLCLLM